MEKIIKILPFEVKEVSPRVLEFVGSTEGKDREGDIIMADGWKLANYKKNPVFMWVHNYTDPPIGKAIKVWAKDGQLRFHIQFAEQHEYDFADTVYKLYKGGYLRASSVGFIPIKSEPMETKEDDEDMMFGHRPTRYLQQELLELSGCPVPANPEALAEAKAKGLIKDETPFMEIVPDPQAVLRPYPNEHACRLRDPDDFQDDSFKRTEREHEGKKYSVIMGRLEGETTLTEQAYPYDKEVWTAAEAKSHCKDHDGTFEPASEEETEVQTETPAESVHSENEIPQVAIADEIDYLFNAIHAQGLNEGNIECAWNLVRIVFDVATREPGSDIPVDIAEKIGAVLNKTNRERLDKIKSLAQDVLDSAEQTDEPDKSLTREEAIEIFREELRAVLAQARGKIRR